MEENAVIDIPDERDYPYEMLVGGEYKNVEFPRDILIVQNQWAQPLTKMACSRYGMAHIANGQNILLDKWQPYQWIDLWKSYLEINPQAETSGATLQSALKQAKDTKIISWYAVVKTIDEAKQAIDRGHFIYTGSSNGDWVSVRDKKIYALRTDSRIVWHVWVIIGYDDTGFIAINSYGQNNGYFSLPYNLFDTTFTKYAIIPTQEIDTILLYKQRIMDGISIESAKTAFTNGFWNGERPKDTVTREEAAAMVERAFEKLSKLLSIPFFPTLHFLLPGSRNSLVGLCYYLLYA